MEPVCAPDSMESPAEALQDVLPQPVPLAGPQCTMISGPITFYGQNVSSRFVGIANGKVNTKAAEPTWASTW
jgi:hypothetical protein